MKKTVLFAIIIIIITNCDNNKVINKEYVGKAVSIKVLPGSGGWNSYPPMTVITTDKQTTFTVRGTPIVSIGDSCYIVTKKGINQHQVVQKYFKGHIIN